MVAEHRAFHAVDLPARLGLGVIPACSRLVEHPFGRIENALGQHAAAKPRGIHRSRLARVGDSPTTIRRCGYGKIAVHFFLGHLLIGHILDHDLIGCDALDENGHGLGCLVRLAVQRDIHILDDRIRFDALDDFANGCRAVIALVLQALDEPLESLSAHIHAPVCPLVTGSRMPNSGGRDRAILGGYATMIEVRGRSTPNTSAMSVLMIPLQSALSKRDAAF